MTDPRFIRRNTKYWRENKPSHPSRRPSFRRSSKEFSFLAFLLSIWRIPGFKKYFFYTILALIIAGTIFFFWVSSGLPDPNKLIDRQVAESTKIYDRTGQTILYEIHGDEKRTLVTLDKIPQNVRDATIAIEDKNFYTHKGFSLWSIVRTAITNVIFNRKAGGSTLDQQFIKNAVLTNEKSYIRKIKEIILAYRLDAQFSKDQILQMYFNEIPYGSNAYGIESASMKYFGKDVQNITLPEAAVLAAMVQSPTYYSPYGPNKDALIARQHTVLDLMVEQGMITKSDAEKAKNAKLVFKNPSDNITAPHFVLYIKQILAEKYGEQTIEQGGLQIYTTLDTYKQQIAEEAINNHADSNEKRYGATNAALVSIDPKTGQILAMVGSRDYFNQNIDGQVNVAMQPRQPGSSFKPIVYATAFTKGYTPNTILYDVVTNFSTTSTPFEPHNYNGKEYGPVTIKKALDGSLNIPAVKALYLTGLDSTIEIAKKLGYTTLNDKNRFGLSLVLGGGEVTLLEHTNAYSAFARDGVLSDPSFILKVVDRDGKTLEEYKPSERRVFDPNIAREINYILTDNNERTFIFGANNYLNLGARPAGVKTGTTNNNRDAWTIGYTPSLVTGVWVGNNNNNAMKAGADGSIVAAPIWNEYMHRVLGDTNIETFTPPVIPITGKPVLDGQSATPIIIKIDKASGLLATDLTPPSFVEERSYQTVHDILFYVNKDDPTGPAPTNPADDPQYTLWESRVQAWAVKNKIISQDPPTEKDNVHIPANIPVFTISNPEDGKIITGNILNVKITASAPRGVNRAEYYIDGNLLSSVSGFPFDLVGASINQYPSGFHELKVRVCDDIDNCSEQKINFNHKP